MGSLAQAPKALSRMRARAGHAASVGFCSVLALMVSGIAGCGGPGPARDQDVYHEASLRPGSVPADGDAERQLLDELPNLAANQPVRYGDRVFIPLDSYTSATGRRCAPIRETRVGGERTRVACEGADAWVFVPDVFGGDDPFDATAPAATQ